MDEKQTKSTKETTTKKRINRMSSMKIRTFFKEKGKEKEEQVEEEPQNQKWVQIRLLPIWLRIILLLLLTIFTIILGAYIGYSVVGDGSGSDLFKKETWTHITDIIQGIE